MIDFQLLVWNQHSQQPILKLTEHTAAVKAIAWSPHQNGLLASGGGTADRCIRFWNTTNGHQLNHVDTGSQVSASSLLSHFHFMFFNRLSSPVDPICLPKFQCFFQLQVCNLAWSKNVNELVSTHGYSQNQIMVWKYPSMAKVCNYFAKVVQNKSIYTQYCSRELIYVFLAYVRLQL